jgi:hypothetical protein
VTATQAPPGAGFLARVAELDGKPVSGIGPALRMCANPQCGGYGNCDQIDKSRPAMGITEDIGPDMPAAEDRVIARLAMELAWSCASDASGVLHVIPDGAEFTVHRNPDAPDGRRSYCAIYSGAVPKDELLAGSPAPEDYPLAYRVKLMGTTRTEDGADGAHP